MKGRTLFSLDEAAAELRISPSHLLDLAHQGRAKVVVASHGLIVKYFAKRLLSANHLKTKEIIGDHFRSPSEYDLEKLFIACIHKIVNVKGNNPYKHTIFCPKEYCRIFRFGTT